MDSGQGRTASTERGYRRYAALYLGDWLSRPLDNISRRDIESRFRLLTERHGEMPANQCLSFLRSVYRRPCVDHEGLRNPVEQWLAGGGRYHRKRRKRISSPAEVLPLWRRGIEAAVGNPVHRDVFLFGLYTGMRRGEILALRWEDVDLDKGLFRVEETKTGVPMELPVTRQLGTTLARRRAEGGTVPVELRGWVFPSRTSARGTWGSCKRTTGRSGVRANVPYGRNTNSERPDLSEGLGQANARLYSVYALSLNGNRELRHHPIRQVSVCNFSDVSGFLTPEASVLPKCASPLFEELLYRLLGVGSTHSHVPETPKDSLFIDRLKFSFERLVLRNLDYYSRVV